MLRRGAAAGGQPVSSARLRLPGLTAAATVSFNAQGLASISAGSTHDMFLALGYLHASERLFQMEMLRRAGQGRVAEVIGEDGLPIDKVTRTLGFYREAEPSFTALSPWAQSRAPSSSHPPCSGVGSTACSGTATSSSASR